MLDDLYAKLLPDLDMYPHEGYEELLRPGTDDWMHHRMLIPLGVKHGLRVRAITEGRVEDAIVFLNEMLWALQESGNYRPSKGRVSTYVVSSFKMKFISLRFGPHGMYRVNAKDRKQDVPTLSLDYRYGSGDRMHEFVGESVDSGRLDTDEAVSVLSQVLDERDAEVLSKYVTEGMGWHKARMTTPDRKTQESMGQFADRIRDHAEVAEWLSPTQTARLFGELRCG